MNGARSVKDSAGTDPALQRAFTPSNQFVLTRNLEPQPNRQQPSNKNTQPCHNQHPESHRQATAKRLPPKDPVAIAKRHTASALQSLFKCVVASLALQRDPKVKGMCGWKAGCGSRGDGCDKKKGTWLMARLGPVGATPMAVRSQWPLRLAHLFLVPELCNAVHAFRWVHVAAGHVDRPHGARAERRVERNQARARR